MKVLFCVFVLGLALFQIPSFASSSSIGTVEARLAEFQGGGSQAAVAEASAGKKCTGSIWCSSWEHCVNGECKPKDAFNRCGPFKSCTIGERCVNGVCKR